jgi:hypothetical protein
MDAFKFILESLIGWMNCQQQHDGRPKFTDEQSRRLAGKAKLIRYGRLK